MAQTKCYREEAAHRIEAEIFAFDALLSADQPYSGFVKPILYHLPAQNRYQQQVRDFKYLQYHYTKKFGFDIVERCDLNYCSLPLTLNCLQNSQYTTSS